MQIIWKGHSCFEIISKSSKGKEVKILIDPFSEKIGLKPLSIEADILLISHDHQDHNNKKVVKGSPFLISGPGEYEIKEIFIQGIEAWHDNSQGKERGKITIFKIESEGIKICHLSDLGQKELNSDQLGKIGDIDILMIPVGGIPHQNHWWGTISAKEASKIISQIEPKILIPMHYLIPKLKIKLDPLDKFLKVMGQKSSQPQNKLSVKKKDLPTEGMKIIILEPN